MNGPISRLIQRVADVKEQEIAAVIWSAAYFFFVLSAYYVLRPIRDEVAVAILEGKPGRVDELSWLFTATLAGILLIHPVFTWLVCRLPRKRFVPLTYHFFVLHLLIFFLLYKRIDPTHGLWIGRVFYVWVSIFNLFVVSVFWSFMNDIFRPGQSKRLFGVVAVGGSIGAISGSTITSTLAGPLGPVNLLLVSALLLELACFASKRLERHEAKLASSEAAEEPTKQPLPSAAVEEPAAQSPPPTVPANAVYPYQAPDSRWSEPPAPANTQEASGQSKASGEEPIGGNVMDGIANVIRSPYLLGIFGLMLFFTISSTFIYFQQTEIIAEVFANNRAGRTKLLANRDLVVNVLALVTQLFLTGRIVRWFGIGIALAFLPALGAVGFALLGVWPVLAAVMALDIVRRAANFAIQRPAREALYAVLPRADKYKAKNFNDTFAYRVGDQIGAWSYPFMVWLGLGASALSFSMVPLSVAWLFLALWIGRKYLLLHSAPKPTPATATVLER